MQSMAIAWQPDGVKGSIDDFRIHAPNFPRLDAMACKTLNCLLSMFGSRPAKAVIASNKERALTSQQINCNCMMVSAQPNRGIDGDSSPS